MTLQSFFIGLLASALGFSMVYKTDAYISFFGLSDWAEMKFSGGTRFFYKIMGVLICFLGVLGMTGQLTGFAEGLFGMLFGYKR